MNIFILAPDPYNAAIQQCDAHIVKMILESTQILCNCHPQEVVPYKRTHYNHPCSVWARESIQNYCWLLDHTYHLLHEYTGRFMRRHKCHSIVSLLPEFKCDTFAQTPFALAIPIECYVFSSSKKGEIDAVASYRKYYKQKAKSMQRFYYTGREMPDFLFH